MEIRVSKDMKESETTYNLAKNLWCSASYGLRIWRIVQCSTFQQIEVIMNNNKKKIAGKTSFAASCRAI